MARDLGFTHSTLKMAGGFQPYPPTWLFIADAPPQPVTQILGSLIRLLIPAVIIPFAQYNWPVPAQPTPRLGFTSANLNSTLLVPGQAPFSQNDWPNPRIPARSIDGLSWVSEGLDSTTLSVPFKQTYWPNPLIAGRGQGSTSQGLNLTELSIPFAQYNWPVPRAIPRSIDYLSWTAEGLDETELSIPFSQLNWPNPIVPGRGLGINSEGLNLTVLSIPFAQYDWPLPQRAQNYVNYISWVSTGLELSTFFQPYALPINDTHDGYKRPADEIAAEKYRREKAELSEIIARRMRGEEPLDKNALALPLQTENITGQPAVDPLAQLLDVVLNYHTAQQREADDDIAFVLAMLD